MKLKNPSLPALRAAEMFVNFETVNGVSEQVADLIADCATDNDARDEIAAYIDEKTGLPELLQACEMLLRATSWNGKDKCYRIGPFADIPDNPVDFLIGAIAKAKGKESTNPTHKG